EASNSAPDCTSIGSSITLRKGMVPISSLAPKAQPVTDRVSPPPISASEKLAPPSGPIPHAASAGWTARDPPKRHMAIAAFLITCISRSLFPRDTAGSEGMEPAPIHNQYFSPFHVQDGGLETDHRLDGIRAGPPSECPAHAGFAIVAGPRTFLIQHTPPS